MMQHFRFLCSLTTLNTDFSDAEASKTDILRGGGGGRQNENKKQHNTHCRQFSVAPAVAEGNARCACACSRAAVFKIKPAHGGALTMESGGIFRTIIITALFVVLVCDYTTLITQLYQSMNRGNNASTSPMKMFTEEDDADASFEMMQTPSSFREDRADLDLEAELDLKDLNLFAGRTRTDVISVVKNVCLPKLICELSSGANQHRLTESETNLLKLIKDTTLGTFAEVPTKYHFAAHMGQLISGTDGVGCHLFYTSCPLPGLQVLKMMRRLKLR